MSAASQIKRLKPAYQVVILEKGDTISYAEPPFSPVYDPVILAARIGRKLMP